MSNAFKIPSVARALSRREFAGFFALIILSVMMGGADGTANFVMGPSAMSWQQAEEWCLANYGTHLASIHSEEESAEANDICTNQCWLGGTCQDGDHGDWVWTDGSPWDYTHWAVGQPDDYWGTTWGDDCVQQYGPGPWGDQMCSYYLHPLCATSPPKSHWIAAGNPAHNDWNGVPNAECAVDSRTQATEASAFAPGDTDIGVSCCTEDGSDGVRKFGDDHDECYQAKTYDEAEAICAENGYRLCSLEEMLGLTTRWKGCWHDSRYNWVSTECTYATGHQVARGKASGSTWDDWDPDYYCQGDDNNQAAHNGWSGHGRDIGVGCCSNDGTMGDRPKCDAHPATYQDAVAVCSSENMRVCTLNEIMSEITAGTGCNYDGIYLWTKDECDAGTDMSASSHFYGSNGETGSDGEGRDFGDFIPMVLGAAAGIAVIAAIVALVVAMRKKKVTEETVTEMSDVVHVPDASAVSRDGDEAVATR